MSHLSHAERCIVVSGRWHSIATDERYGSVSQAESSDPDDQRHLMEMHLRSASELDLEVEVAGSFSHALRLAGAHVSNAKEMKTNAGREKLDEENRVHHHHHHHHEDGWVSGESMEEEGEAAADALRCWVVGGQRLYEEALLHPNAQIVDLTIIDRPDISKSLDDRYPTAASNSEIRLAYFPARHRWDHQYKSRREEEKLEGEGLTRTLYRRIHRRR